MTLWDAVVMVLSFFGSPLMVALYGTILILLGGGMFVTIPAIAEAERWVVPSWLILGVMLILFGVSLLVWVASSGYTNPVSW